MAHYQEQTKQDFGAIKKETDHRWCRPQKFSIEAELRFSYTSDDGEKLLRLIATLLLEKFSLWQTLQ